MPENYVGIAGGTVYDVLGWERVPGSAWTMVADLWVEMYWGGLGVAVILGWVFGYTWRRSLADERFWTSAYVVLALVSVYLVSQTMEAVIFRVLIILIPTAIVWRKATQPRAPEGIWREWSAEESSPRGRPLVPRNG